MLLNPRQVFNLAVVRALPDADFAGFPTGQWSATNGVPATFPNAGRYPTNQWDRTLAARCRLVANLERF